MKNARKIVIFSFFSLALSIDCCCCMKTYTKSKRKEKTTCDCIYIKRICTNAQYDKYMDST